MRKLRICVPMILLLLTGCAGGGASEAEKLALAVRGSCLEAAAWTAQVAVTADYGQRVYQYELTASWDGEETALTVTAPDTVAGITARTKNGTGLLEYEDLVLETGPLDDQGLDPVSAVPILWEEARSGCIMTCGLEENGQLRLDCGDPEGTPGTGREVTLWFDSGTHALMAGEIRVDGFRVIRCDYTDFTMG